MTFTIFKNMLDKFLGVIYIILIEENFHLVCTANNSGVSKNILVQYDSTLLFGYKLALVEFILCKMNYHIFLTNISQTGSIRLHGDRLEKGEFEENHLVTISQLYRFEIITGVKVIKDNHYLAFLKLFDYLIWLAILLSAVITSITFCILTKHVLKFSYLLENIIRLLTLQSTNLTNNLKWSLKIENKWTRLLTLLIICAWLQSASILIKNFGNVLLNSYFNVKSEPYFKTLSAINARTVDVAADPDAFDQFQYYTINANNIEKLRSKAQTFRKHSELEWLDEIFLPKHFKSLVNCKLCIICDTFLRQIFEQRFKKYRKYFTRAERRYSPDFTNFIISKQHFLAEKLMFLFKQIIEAGLIVHQDTVLQIINSLSFRNNEIRDTLIEESEQLTIYLDEIYRNTIVILVTGYFISSIILFYEVTAVLF